MNGKLSCTSTTEKRSCQLSPPIAMTRPTARDAAATARHHTDDQGDARPKSVRAGHPAQLIRPRRYRKCRRQRRCSSFPSAGWPREEGRPTAVNPSAQNRRRRSPCRAAGGAPAATSGGWSAAPRRRRGGPAGLVTSRRSLMDDARLGAVKRVHEQVDQGNRHRGEEDCTRAAGKSRNWIDCRSVAQAGQEKIVSTTMALLMRPLICRLIIVTMGMAAFLRTWRKRIAPPHPLGSRCANVVGAQDCSTLERVSFATDQRIQPRVTPGMTSWAASHTAVGRRQAHRKNQNQEQANKSSEWTGQHEPGSTGDRRGGLPDGAECEWQPTTTANRIERRSGGPWREAFRTRESAGRLYFNDVPKSP